MNERIYEKQGDTLLKPKEEIVRCKDCKHYSNGHLCQYFRRYGATETKETDFCSFGERRAEQ